MLTLIQAQIIPGEYIDTLMKKITTLTDILGLKTDKKEEMLDEDIESLIAERQQARKR